MVQVKRTYSSRDKKQRNFAEENAQRKRTKVNSDDDHHSPPNRSTKRSVLLKKGLKQHSGPISVPDQDDIDNDPVTKKDKVLKVFDKVLAGKLKPVTIKQHTIYGSREDFEETMTDQSLAKESNARPRSGLPTPPSDYQKKQQGDRFNRPVSALTGLGKKSIAEGSSPTIPPTETSKRFAKVIKVEQPKVSYVQKQFEAARVPPPHWDLLEKRLSKTSSQAQMWSTNQAQSGFLRLPFELRNLIYEEVLGRKTLNIYYETYHMTYTTYEKNKASQVAPVFKYRSAIYRNEVNPYSTTQKSISKSNSLTFLNNISRQLYLETAVLPYKLNLISFDSHLIFTNFILLENRLSRNQRHAIKRIIIRDDVPGANMLEYLPNLETVFLGAVREDKTGGRYRVVRQEGRQPKLVWEPLR